MDAAELFIPLSLFATVFGLYFLRSRENLSMIERGINPRRSYGRGPRPYQYMKYAFLLIGGGLAIAVAYILDYTFLQELTKTTLSDGTVHYQDNSAFYLSLLAIGGGLGLYFAFRLERKYLHNTPNEEGTE